MLKVTFPDKYHSEDFFTLQGGEVCMSGHDYVNSPYETCDSCGNCSGARCTHCHKIITRPHFEFSLDVVEVEVALSEYGDKIANDIAMDGRSNGVIVEYPEPSSDWLKVDPQVRHAINTVIEMSNPKTFGCIEEGVLNLYGCEGHDRYRGHIANQLELYWLECNRNHEIACQKH